MKEGPERVPFVQDNDGNSFPSGFSTAISTNERSLHNESLILKKIISEYLHFEIIILSVNFAIIDYFSFLFPIIVSYLKFLLLLFVSSI